MKKTNKKEFSNWKWITDSDQRSMICCQWIGIETLSSNTIKLISFWSYRDVYHDKNFFLLIFYASFRIKTL